MNYNFFNKFRNPDEDFLDYLQRASTLAPYWTGFFIIIILLISVVLYALVGTDSLITKVLHWLLKPFSSLILFLILVPYIVLKILLIYVRIKLRRKHSREVADASGEWILILKMRI